MELCSFLSYIQDIGLNFLPLDMYINSGLVYNFTIHCKISVMYNMCVLVTTEPETSEGK